MCCTCTWFINFFPAVYAILFVSFCYQQYIHYGWMLLLLILIIFRLVSYIFGLLLLLLLVGRLFFVCSFLVFRIPISVFWTRLTSVFAQHCLFYSIVFRTVSVTIKSITTLCSSFSAWCFTIGCVGFKLSCLCFLDWGGEEECVFLQRPLFKTALKSANGLGTGLIDGALQNRFKAFFVVLR